MNKLSRYTAVAIGATALMAVAAFAYAIDTDIPSLRMAKPVEYNLPTLPDTAERGVNTFKATDLLKQAAPASQAFWRDQMQDWTTILPDTAGVYHLDVAKHPGGNSSGDRKAIVSRLAATLRPDRFFIGTLKLSTPLAGALYVNGEKVAEKSVQDSVAGDVDAKITLQPAQEARIEVRLLKDGDTKGASEVKLSLTPDDKSKDVVLTYNPAKHYFDIMTTVVAPRVSWISISPDGRYMIVCTTETADGKDYKSAYDIRECATGKVTSLNFGEGMSWMPGRPSTLTFSRSNADGTFDILTQEYPSMRLSTLAEGLPSEASDYVMSPKGDYIIFETEAEGKKPSGTMQRIANPDDRIPGNRNRSYLSMVRFDDNVVRPLTYGGATTSLSDISADGSKILYITARETPSKYPFYEFDLVQLDLKTNVSDTLLRREPTLSTADYSPDGRRVFITAGPSFHGNIGANCGDHPIANDYDIQGYLLDVAAGSVKAMTRDFDPSIYGSPMWNRHDGRIYFRAQKGFDCFVYSLDPTDGKITQLHSETDFIRNFSIGENESRYMAYTGMGYNYMGRAYMLDLKSGKTNLISDPAGELIAVTDFGDSQMWSFTAPDGTVVEGTVTLPPDFSPEKKYPLIVYYYGGTTPSTHTNHSPYSPTLFASRGYVVYVVNPSGTIGYGQEYSARHVNAWGDRTADEIIYGTERFCEEHPFVDKTKIGCLGASYGGFMTQLLTTKTDLFAAAVSHAGISNVASYWGEGFWGYSYNAVAAAESYPWSNPEVFTRNSALFNADKIHTPLLLLHGTVDTNVPIGESIQLFNALKILGRDVEFVTVDGENHIIMDFRKRKEWHATIMAWFEKWLKGDSRWWDSIYKD